MALCIDCIDRVQDPKGSRSICQIVDCDNPVAQGFQYCRSCAEELRRCERCGEKLPPKKK